MKKFYKHKKVYSVRVREEIDSSKIFPIAFIQEENKESEIIVRHLGEFVAQECGGKTINSKELSSYFVKSRQLNKQKVVQTIKEVISGLSQNEKTKLLHYIEGPDLTKLLIDQIIFNQMIKDQLTDRAESQTKEVFTKIMKTEDWIELVEWNDNAFITNRNKLGEKLKALGVNLSSEVSLLVDSFIIPDQQNLLPNENQQSLLSDSDINIHLLDQAICVEAFNHHSIDIPVRLVTVDPKIQMPALLPMRIMKTDLEPIPLIGSNDVGYGINYGVYDDTNILYFHGKPWNKLQGKTLALQIFYKGRIMKEIFIKGIENNQEKNEPVHEIL